MKYFVLLIVVGLIALLLAMLWGLISEFFKNIKKIRLYNKARKHLQDAPLFTHDLTDTYVKFRGRVVTPNQSSSKLQNKPCILYKTRILAEWQTKEKKPKKGLITNHKTLYLNESSVPLPIHIRAGDGTLVHVDFDSFNKSGNVIDLLLNKTTSPDCPNLCANSAQRKYKTYISLEKCLVENAEVLIYGRLEKDQTGQMHIKPTGRSDYPSVFQVSSPSERKLELELAKKLSKARVKLGFFAIVLLTGLAFFLYHYH